MPYAPNANQGQGYLHFSWTWLIYGTNGSVAVPQLCQFYTNTAVTGNVAIFPFINYQPSQTISFQYPSNGNPNQFTLIFPSGLLNQLSLIHI